MHPLTLLLISLGAVAAAFVVAASKTSDASGASPPHVSPDASVVLLGDSLGVGLAPHLQKLMTGLFDARVMTGRTAAGALQALQGDEHTFDVKLLSLGSNDALLDPAGFRAALTMLVSQLGPGAYWIVPPGFTYGTTKNPAGAQAFADTMTSLGVPALATSPVPPAPDDPMRLHLSPAGYEAFAEEIAARLYA